jgi:transposase InsO family protein
MLSVMRERRLIGRRRPLQRRLRPGSSASSGPTSSGIWTSQASGSPSTAGFYLIAAIDCCTREITAWQLETCCRAPEAIVLIQQAAADRAIAPGTLTLATDNGSPFTAPAFKAVLDTLEIAHRRGYRDPESQAFIESWFGRFTQRRPGGMSSDRRRGPGGDRQLRHVLPPPAEQPALPHAARSRGDWNEAPGHLPSVAGRDNAGASSFRR